MSRLHEIPVVVAEPHRAAIHKAPAQGPSASVLAILHEIDSHLERLHTDATDAVIDLRWLSRLPGDIDALREVLGKGEVRAEVGALGATVVRETAIPCVWWITHRDANEQLIGEFIEVTGIPAILAADPGDAARGRALLAERRSVTNHHSQTLSSVS
ncbi:MAG TPA: hydrogenase expression/formation C-terminal domain-containing protein [Burkholderiales bacterium]